VAAAPPSAVAVHFGSLDLAATEVERLALLLAPEERARAARFAFAEGRRRFIVRRARLRETLAAVVGTSPERLVYTENGYGKPMLAEGALHFSASHSHELWAVALAAQEVGVDVEHHQPDLDWRDLAAGLFRADERAALDALAYDDAVRGFFDCWARKEAFVKAIGQGLSYPLDAFAVSVTRETRLLAGANGWTMTGLSLADRYSGALVTVDTGSPIALTLHPASV
jgi:4'-phosphopantetheinyl transferase